MKISLFDKISLILKIYLKLYKMPSKIIFKTFLKPVESIRYVEFSYLLKFLKKNKININGKILDLSSPYVMAYLLNKSENEVIKTDINDMEKKSIKEKRNFKFKKEDGTNLSFDNDSFDLTYSVSVIEHIYKRFIDAVNEMVRVTKSGGYIYISTPVSSKHEEEWIEEDIYSDQYKSDKKTFFQYRFSLEDINEILNAVKDAELFSKSVYWERNEGDYDNFIHKLRDVKFNKNLEFFRNSWFNIWLGSKILSSTSGDFKNSKSYGNISLILKKK